MQSHCKMKTRQGTVLSSLVCLQTQRPGATNGVSLCLSQAKENLTARRSKLSTLSMQEKSESWRLGLSASRLHTRLRNIPTLKYKNSYHSNSAKMNLEFKVYLWETTRFNFSSKALNSQYWCSNPAESSTLSFKSRSLFVLLDHSLMYLFIYSKSLQIGL